MKTNYLIVLLVLGTLSVEINASGYKSSCVSKFVKFFSKFFASSQVSGYADAAMEQIIVKANSSKIVDAVLSAAYDNLTSSQYTQGMSLVTSAMAKFGSYSAINSTIQKCINGGAPVLLKLYPKVWAKIKAKTGDSAKMDAGYKYADGKFKLGLCKKLVKKCKAKLSDSEWSTGTSLLKNFVNFDVLGYSV